MNRNFFYCRDERLAHFAENYPEAALELFAMGEPVSVDFLRLIAEKNPDFVDKLLNVKFNVAPKPEPYSMGDWMFDDSKDIYKFMQKMYGKCKVPDLVLNRQVLWDNFLFYASNVLYRSGALIEKFARYVKTNDYAWAYKMLECVNKRYVVKLQKSVSKEELLYFIDCCYHLYGVNDVANIFRVDYLIADNVLSTAIVGIYLYQKGYSVAAVKKVLAQSKGFEILVDLNDFRVNCILDKLKLI